MAAGCSPAPRRSSAPVRSPLGFGGVVQRSRLLNLRREIAQCAGDGFRGELGLPGPGAVAGQRDATGPGSGGPGGSRLSLRTLSGEARFRLVVRGNRRWRPAASPGHLSGCRDRRAGRRPARGAAGRAGVGIAARWGSPRWLPPSRPAGSARPWAPPRSDASSATPAGRSWSPPRPACPRCPSACSPWPVCCLRRIGLYGQHLQYCRSTILARRRPLSAPAGRPGGPLLEGKRLCSTSSPATASPRCSC